MIMLGNMDIKGNIKQMTLNKEGTNNISLKTIKTIYK